MKNDKVEFDLKTLIRHLEVENGVNGEIVMTSIEQAMTKAASKFPGVTNDFRVSIDRNDMTLKAYDTYVVSDEDSGVGFVTLRDAMRYTKRYDLKEGDVVEIEIPPKYLGRIVANSSKQMITQKIREAKRSNIFSEYSDSVGNIVSGTVSGVEKGDIYVTVGKYEMVLPKSEQLHKERFAVGNSVKAVIKSVNMKSRHSPVTLSRSSNAYLEALLRSEISEMSDGTVDIVSISRDPGSRAKISVVSHNSKVDSVGACIGKGGMRIKNITNELSGEKLDIVRYSDDHIQYVKDALLPAKIDSVELEDDGSYTVIVGSDEYSKALGRNGQNVMLASKLIGARINIRKSEATMTFDEKKSEAIREMSDSFGISLFTAAKLIDVGYLNVDGIAEDDIDSFVVNSGLDEIEARGIHAAALKIHELTSENV